MGSIGSNIRNIRIEKGMSLKDLATESGVTNSLISQIEHDKANPSITTLLAISKAMEVDIAEFFKNLGLYHDKHIVRKEERLTVKGHEKRWIQHYLTNQNFSNLVVTINRLDPGVSTKEIPEMNHPNQTGYEFFLVTKGCMTLELENDFYKLNEGDAVTFNAEQHHNLYNNTESEVEIISVIIPGIK